MVCLLAGGLSPAAADGQCHYTYVEIPNPPGWTCYGEALNELGHVAGTTYNLGDNNRGFVWTPETGTALMPLPPGMRDLDAHDINDSGHVVGTMVDTTDRAFFWDGQEYTIIPMPPDTTRSEALALNNGDQVVGQFTRSVSIGGGVRAFSWQNGVFTDLGEIIGVRTSRAQAVNESGVRAGRAHSSNPSVPHAFRFGNAPEWLPEPAKIILSDCTKLSNNGFAVGFGAPVDFGDPDFHSFGLAWSINSVELIEPPSGWRNLSLNAVNDHGRAVGSVTPGATFPIVWQNGQLTDLRTLVRPTAPSNLHAPLDINNAGQIVCFSSIGTVMLNPVWLPGDLTGDCHVSFNDLILVLSDFGSPQGTFPRGDVDRDGEVDLADLAILLAHWGQ